MRKRIDLTGQRFGRLFVIKEVDRNKHNQSMWKCLCDCGNKIIILGCNLKSGHTKSCGCYNSEKSSKRMKGENHHCYGKTGKNHPTYNPNLTDEERQDKRLYPEYYEWRLVVYKRDNYICQYCGKRGGKLVAHHLESYKSNPKLRISLENGITLCEKCHLNFHHQYGRRNNTKNQFEEFCIKNKEYEVTYEE